MVGHEGPRLQDLESPLNLGLTGPAKSRAAAASVAPRDHNAAQSLGSLAPRGPGLLN